MAEERLSDKIWAALGKIHFVFWILQLLGVSTLILTTIQEIREHLSLLIVMILDLTAILAVIIGIIFQHMRQRKAVDLVVSRTSHPKVIHDRANPIPKYLVVGDSYFLIPNPPTFEYLGKLFGFDWKDCIPMSLDEIKRKFIGGEGKGLPNMP